MSMSDFWCAVDRTAELRAAERYAFCAHAPAEMKELFATVQGAMFAPCCPLCGAELGERSYVRS